MMGTVIDQTTPMMSMIRLSWLWSSNDDDDDDDDDNVDVHIDEQHDGNYNNYDYTNSWVTFYTE